MFARVLFLLLLAANLGFGAWLLLAPPAAIAQLPPTDAGVPPLVLLNEREGAVADAAELARAPEPIGASANLSCTTLGPFPTQSDLRRAMTALTPLTERIQFRESRALRSRGWWVYLPAFGSREEALAAARALSAKGVRDYYVVTAGDQENTISLGLFRDGDNARRRRDEVSALGLDAQLSERSEDTPQYWLDYAVTPAQRFDWRDRVPDRSALQAREVPCGQLR
jgi:hypothetical protein